MQDLQCACGFYTTYDETILLRQVLDVGVICAFLAMHNSTVFVKVCRSDVCSLDFIFRPSRIEIFHESGPGTRLLPPMGPYWSNL
jgi:hypothetical protein